MADERGNMSNREDGHQHGRAEAAFGEELLCCYACGKIYFTKRPIKLRTPSSRSFHVCAECSNSLLCFGCGGHVTSRTAVVVEKPPDHPGDIFCAKCRNHALFNVPLRSQSFGGRVRLAVAAAFGDTRRFFRRIGGIRVRFGRK
jgi:hypothetical protein